jgi:hypothetical protein
LDSQFLKLELGFQILILEWGFVKLVKLELPLDQQQEQELELPLGFELHLEQQQQEVHCLFLLQASSVKTKKTYH